MKNPMQKKNLRHIKHVKWPLIVGGYAFVLKTLGNVVTQRDSEQQRANVMSAMFGSLVEFVGADTYNAWEARMSELYPLEEGAPQKEATASPPVEIVPPVESETGPDPVFDGGALPTPVTLEDLDDEDSIEIASPIEVVELEAGDDPIDIPEEESDVDVEPAVEAEAAEEPTER